MCPALQLLVVNRCSALATPDGFARLGVGGGGGWSRREEGITMGKDRKMKLSLALSLPEATLRRKDKRL